MTPFPAGAMKIVCYTPYYCMLAMRIIQKETHCVMKSFPAGTMKAFTAGQSLVSSSSLVVVVLQPKCSGQIKWSGITVNGLCMNSNT